MVFDGEGLSPEATEFNPSPIVNELRQELDVWRGLPNPTQWKATPLTQRLLQQLEVVEATIWLAEVVPQLGSAAEERREPGLAPPVDDPPFVLG
jgi:type III restriction enzyme